MLFGGNSFAYNYNCPPPASGVVRCSGCDCVCNLHGRDVHVKPGQQIRCFEGQNVFEGFDDSAEMQIKNVHCVATGAPLLNCNGENVSARSDNRFLPNPPGYVRPDEPKLVEGFWIKLFERALGKQAGQEIESQISGPKSNEGLDDPNTDLYLNTQRQALPKCAPQPQPCYELYWRAKIENCRSLPEEPSGTARSEFELCINDFQEFKDCLGDLERDGAGPWDAFRTREYISENNLNVTLTPQNYLQYADLAAVWKANECIDHRLQYVPAFEGAFDGVNNF